MRQRLFLPPASGIVWACSRSRCSLTSSTKIWGPIINPAALLVWTDSIVESIAAFARELDRRPDMSREEDRHWCKLHNLDCGLFYKSVVWPQARLAIGLPRDGRSGCRKGTRHIRKRQRKSGVRFSQPARLLAARHG